MIRVGLVRVTGYTGMELARLLTGHPNMAPPPPPAPKRASGSAIDPFLNGLPGADVIIEPPEPELIAKECDLAFLAVRTRRPWRRRWERGLKVVDLFRRLPASKSAETYEQWYKVEHKRPDLLPRSGIRPAGTLRLRQHCQGAPCGEPRLPPTRSS